MKTKLLFVAAMLACLATTEARLFACSCAGTPSPCVAAGRAQAVFVGQVVDIAKLDPGAPSNAPDGPYYRRVSFKVTESLRGNVEATTVVFTGSGGGDCGYGFSTGKSYLIYAHKATTGQLTTNACGRTRQATSSAEGEIKELRALAKQPKECVKP